MNTHATGSLWRRFSPPTFLSVTVLVAGTAVGASPLTPRNLLVTVNEFTGSSTAPTYIAEYTATGSRVQIIASVPSPGGTTPTTDQARDLAVGADGAVYLYNGTATPHLARLEVATSNWTQQPFAGWSTSANLTYGGLCRSRQFIFAADMATSGAGSPQGVVRFDPDGAPVRFATSIQPIDIHVGPDLVLYALNGGGSPRSTVYKFDARTFDSLGTINVAFADHRAVAVAADGTIFLADWSGVIRRYSANGTLLDSLTVPGESFSDIDIDGDGRIALGTGFVGDVVLTDVSLDNYTRFLPTDNQRSGDSFVAWIPVPAQPPGLSISKVGDNVAIKVSGSVGASYTIEHSNPGDSATNAWTVLTNLTLPSSPITALDTLPVSGMRFYRAVSWP